MTRPFPIHLPPEQGFVRNARFGIELLDGVTLEPVSAGVRVTAEGLHGKPLVNASGVFVWLEDPTPLRKVTIDPGVLPYEPVELEPPLQLPLTRVELAPRLDYPFAAGTTGMRGILIESKDGPPVPVGDAVVHLRWLDENSVFRDAPTLTRTEPKGGTFAAVLRLMPADTPFDDPSGTVTVRLVARRGAEERQSGDLKLPQGRVADPSTFPQGPNALIFAWDKLT